MSIRVAFDTNLYRALSDDELSLVQARERKANILPVASFLAASELLSRVDPGPFDASRRASVRRLWLHCRRTDAGGEYLPISADPMGAVAHAVFGVQHTLRHRTADFFGRVVQRIALAAPMDDLDDLKESLSRIKAHRDDIERRFVASLRSLQQLLGAQPSDAPAHDVALQPSVDEFFERGMARHTGCAAIILNAAREHDVVCSEDDSLALGRRHADSIAVTLTIYESVVERVLRGGASPEKCANDIWDAYFGLFASDWARIGGREALLVTNDRRITTAARDAGVPERVLSLAAYRADILHENDGGAKAG